SRTGHRYPVTPPPIIEPLPEPIIPAIPATSETVAMALEDDLPLPSTWEYGPPWLEETQPQQPPGSQPTPGDPPPRGGKQDEQRPPGTCSPRPEADIPPF
ncbi:hypothetical protein N5079_35140, partial [Planotetraspora sp. A-T 1434]|nr:hypothetical protein [Planotetraspora sp. A-T 1434]